MANYSFVVDSQWTPLTMQEMLTPFTMYKEAYDKDVETLNQLYDKADPFSYLDDNIDSEKDKRSRDIYDKYIGDLRAAATKLNEQGLPSSRRDILNIRRRYAGEIGRLEKADIARQEEYKRRQTLDANDPTRIYATDTTNLSLDDFLDNKRPNDYSVSGDYLYKKGAEIGASTSSRIYSNPTIKKMTDAFVNFSQTQGITQETLDAFRANLSSQPAFQKAIMDELKAEGVTDHLKGAALQRAIQSTVNGFINGAIYKRTDNPQANPDHITPYQQRQIELANRSFNLELAERGLKLNGNGEIVVDKEGLPFQMQQLKNDGKKSGSGSSGSGSGDTSHLTESQEAHIVEWDGGDPAGIGEHKRKEKTYKVGSGENSEREHDGNITNYDDLPQFAKDEVDKIVGNRGDVDHYDIYYRPFKSNTLGLFNDKAQIEVVPRNIVTDDSYSLDDIMKAAGMAGQ